MRSPFSGMCSRCVYQGRSGILCAAAAAPVEPQLDLVVWKPHKFILKCHASRQLWGWGWQVSRDVWDGFLCPRLATVNLTVYHALYAPVWPSFLLRDRGPPACFWRGHMLLGRKFLCRRYCLRPCGTYLHSGACRSLVRLLEFPGGTPSLWGEG